MRYKILMEGVFFFRETRYYVKDKEVLDSDLFIKIKKIRKTQKKKKKL